MTEPGTSGAFREVRGTFAQSATMQDAVGRLSVSGFDRADITLPDADEPAPLGDAQNPANTDEDARQLRTLETSTAASAAAMAAAGVTVATGGAAIPAVAAAVAAGGLVGGAAYAVRDTANDREQESRTERAAEGRLVLAVRTPTEAKQRQAAEILRAAGAEHVETID